MMMYVLVLKKQKYNITMLLCCHKYIFLESGFAYSFESMASVAFASSSFPLVLLVPLSDSS